MKTPEMATEHLARTRTVEEFIVGVCLCDVWLGSNEICEPLAKSRQLYRGGSRIGKAERDTTGEYELGWGGW